MDNTIRQLIHRSTGLLGLAAASVLGMSLTAPDVLMANPHTTVLPKNTPTTFAAREELEGAGSVVNSFSVPHGCNGTAIRAMAVVFPNGPATAKRVDTDAEVVLSDHIDGNPVMSPRPVQDHNVFRKIERVEGAVPPFVSRGNTVTTDVRAFRYTKGRLDPDLVGLIPWRATYPRFKADSCAASLKIDIAVANYCTHSNTGADRADVWMAHLTPAFDDPAIVAEGFWPNIRVVRDLDNNPLPGSCGDGYEIEVYPHAHDIDEYLPIPSYWPAQ